MTLLFAAGAAIFGAILGSFINALSFRFGTGVSILHGRSRCMRCGHMLSAADLIPVISYIFLRGRCRYCGSRISPQYPLVEVVAGLLSLGVWWLYPAPGEYAFFTLVWMVLLFVAVYDLRHKVIPWSASVPLAAAALVYTYLSTPAWWDLAAGPVLALPLFLLWLLSRGTWMGLGDPVLELSLGWLLGLTAGLTGLLLGFWIGALVGIGAMILGRGVTMKSEVPLAPFLILGAAAAYFLHVDFFQNLPLLF